MQLPTAWRWRRPPPGLLQCRQDNAVLPVIMGGQQLLQRGLFSFGCGIRAAQFRFDGVQLFHNFPVLFPQGVAGAFQPAADSLKKFGEHFCLLPANASGDGGFEFCETL